MLSSPRPVLPLAPTCSKYDAAWKALAEGNRLQDEAAPHDPRPDEQSTEAVLSLFQVRCAVVPLCCGRQQHRVSLSCPVPAALPDPPPHSRPSPSPPFLPLCPLQPPKTFSNDPADQFYAALLAGGGGYRDPAGLRPIFVVGLPRSGSTLIEQILASHSQVGGASLLLEGASTCGCEASTLLPLPGAAAGALSVSPPLHRPPSPPFPQAWGAGEDTALAPLVPRLLEALRPGADGNVEGARIAAVGQAYVEEMRGRLPADKKEAKWIVDKMLRNVW